MNTLKTLVILALLGAVGYGVYVSITRNPHQADDLGTAPSWATSNPKTPTVGPPTSTAAQPPASNLGATPPGGGINVQLPPMPTASPGPALSPPTAVPAAAVPGGVASLAPPTVSPGTAAPTTVPPSGPSPPAYPAPSYPAIANNVAATGNVSTPASSSATGGTAAESDMLMKFSGLMEAAQAKLDEGRLDEGLQMLSPLYYNDSLPAPQLRQLTTLLDQLAGTVIYSRKHLLEPPYKVQAGERLAEIAQKYNVPWELLARINGIRNPDVLTPGQELKVVRGPFSAVISLDRFELTLMLQGRYAGRFPLGIGVDQPKLEGEYTVRDKITNPMFGARDGTRFSAGDRNNPLGSLLLDLGNQVGIHGTNDSRNIGHNAGRGTNCLNDCDIDDVFGILSIGSQVVIRR